MPAQNNREDRGCEDRGDGIGAGDNHEEDNKNIEEGG